MKITFQLLISIFALFYVIALEAFASELPETQPPKQICVYYKTSPKLQDKDLVWRERFIVRLIRTKEDLNNKGKFQEQGFKMISLQSVIDCIKEEKTIFSDTNRLTLVNFNYSAFCMLREVLLNLNPYSIESEEVDNASVSKRFSRFLIQLKKEEEERLMKLVQEGDTDGSQTDSSATNLPHEG